MSQRGLESQGGALFDDDGQDGLMHRVFLRGSGLSAKDVRRRPVIGIANSASELNPCNLGFSSLLDLVKAGVREAGGLPLVFPTISISEPFTRPTSLYLRNLMSMDVEEMISTAPVDGVILLGGCDKTIPAQLMGAISADKPTVMLVAGPRPVSRHGDNDSFTVDDVWPLCDARRVGEVSDEQWLALEGDVNTDVGTCNVMGTAATMAAIAEALGFALPGSALAGATSARRRELARLTGHEAVAAVTRGHTAAEQITPESLENAFRVVSALGGSTNAVIHLEAIAGRAGLRIGRDNFARWSADTPLVANVRPGGQATLPELDAVGGVPAVMAAIADRLHPEVRTATGETWRSVLDALPDTDERVIAPADRPLQARGGIAMLSGTLAPSGAVVKVAGVDDLGLLQHRGRAVVFDGIDDLNARIDDPDLPVDATSILVLRGLGPVGAPGMPEVGHIPVPAKLHREGVTDMVRISDARMSGTSRGVVVLHVAPEAAVGGPLARLRDGDEIVLDVADGRLDVLVDADEYAAREPWRPTGTPTRGFRRLHAERVLQADQGCDFDFLTAEEIVPVPGASE